MINLLTSKDVNAIQLSNIFAILWTLLVSKLDKSISFNTLQSWNILDIFNTFLVLNLLKSTEVNETHSSNKLVIFSTFSVLISPKLICFNNWHSKNILDISLLFDKSKLEISISVNFLQDANNPAVDSTFLVLKFLRFNEVKSLQNWNIYFISLTLLVSKFDTSKSSNAKQLSNI